MNTYANFSLADKTVKEYSVYKPYLIFFGLVECLYQKVFKVCPTYRNKIL